MRVGSGTWTLVSGLVASMRVDSKSGFSAGLPEADALGSLETGPALEGAIASRLPTFSTEPGPAELITTMLAVSATALTASTTIAVRDRFTELTARGR